MEPFRVLVADDNAQFRAGLRALLQAAPETEVAGEAATGQEAIGQAEQLQPDVVLMDIKMPGMNGIEAARRILQASPHIGVLMLTMLEDDDSVFDAMRARARGYLLKGALKAEILRAIRGVCSGEAIFGPAIARRLMGYFAAARPARFAQAFPQLTDREQEILQLLAGHQTNAEIAARLSLTPKTVRNHVSNIFTKLQGRQPRGGDRPRPRRRLARQPTTRGAGERLDPSTIRHAAVTHGPDGDTSGDPRCQGFHHPPASTAQPAPQPARRRINRPGVAPPPTALALSGRTQGHP
jgi:DNA-binding NarL/FixJ family response regulator